MKNRKILLFGGTTEGRLLAEALSARSFDLTVCVATALGAEELRGLSCTVRSGRLDETQMAELAEGFDLVIDATHPYSVLVSENIRTACERSGVPLQRVRRDSSEIDGCISVNSAAEAAACLQTQGGNVLLAIGSKELGAFAGLDPARLYPRILPTHPGIAACEALDIPHRNILALQGPFSEELNAAMFRQYDIRFLVTRNSGSAGGCPEKLSAARKTGVVTLLIERQGEEGLTVEELLKRPEVQTE